MAVLTTQLDRDAEEFARRREGMEELVAELRERRIPLEVCPTINVVTRVFETWEEHPLRRLLQEGLVVTLNADVPGMTGTSVLGEYELARRVFGFDDDTLARIAKAGARAAFLDEAFRASLERDIDRWLATR